MVASPDGATAARLERAAWLAWPETRQVFAALVRDGHEARAVGGAVRNSLLGQAVTEVDLATTARPDEVIALAERAGLRAVPTGLDHGTVTVIAGHRPFEVTTLRHDVETFGRRAKVAFTDDWTADARRRDFTINALYAAADGSLFDPLGGRADVLARRVRFIGDAHARIREDYLRILRFFRFNADYATPPFDAHGLAACVRERAGLAMLSPERVHVELARLLVSGGAASALEAMLDYGVLVDVLGGVPYLGRFRRLAAIEEACEVKPSAMRRLAALTVSVSEDVERLGVRLRLSGAERASLSCTLRARTLSDESDAPAAKTLLYRAGPDCYRDAVLLAWANAGAPAEAPGWRRLLSLPERWTAPAFPLSGADLLALGLAEGPAVGRVLKAVEAAWISDGFAAGKAELMAMARRLAERRE